MEKITITGTLEYLGWQRPWTVHADSGDIDLSEHFWRVVQHLEGKATAQGHRRDCYSLCLDADSEMVLQHGGVGEGVYIEKREGFGFSNVAAYIEATLCSLNARRILVRVTGDDAIEIEAAPGEDVPCVQYYDGNLARIPPGEEVARCGLGRGPSRTCIFLLLSPGGFQCAKFDGYLSRNLLDRKANGTMAAQRIGNCRCTGREGT